MQSECLRARIQSEGQAWGAVSTLVNEATVSTPPAPAGRRSPPESSRGRWACTRELRGQWRWGGGLRPDLAGLIRLGADPHPLHPSHLPRKSPRHLPPVTAPNTGLGRAEVSIWSPVPSFEGDRHSDQRCLLRSAGYLLAQRGSGGRKKGSPPPPSCGCSTPLPVSHPHGLQGP